MKHSEGFGFGTKLFQENPDHIHLQVQLVINASSLLESSIETTAVKFYKSGTTSS